MVRFFAVMLEQRTEGLTPSDAVPVMSAAPSNAASPCTLGDVSLNARPLEGSQAEGWGAFDAIGSGRDGGGGFTVPDGWTTTLWRGRALSRITVLIICHKSVKV